MRKITLHLLDAKRVGPHCAYIVFAAQNINLQGDATPEFTIFAAQVRKGLHAGNSTILGSAMASEIKKPLATSVKLPRGIDRDEFAVRLASEYLNAEDGK